ncbi:MAG: 5'-nucleotidase C-terminal domain-containing protein [Spirochaetaceae bacterium]|nr:5'-nucleotidase C-terminal domain-containing protein [Spirochaetaceae bacterium]
MKRIFLGISLLCALGAGTLFARPVTEMELARRSQAVQRQMEAAKAAQAEEARKAAAQKQEPQQPPETGSQETWDWNAQSTQIAQGSGGPSQGTPQTAQGGQTQTAGTAQGAQASSADAGRQRVQPIRGVKRNQRYELILLHTNDHHGTVLPAADGQGGLAQRSALVKLAKILFPQVLLVDAGDINTGTALSNMFNAEPDILAYNIMGYDAGTAGNHEFDGTLEKLQKQQAQMNFPLVTSNIKVADGNYLGVPYLLKGYDGFTVGIFGITTLRTKSIASPDSSLEFIDEFQAVQNIVDFLKNQEQVDIVIGLTHLGDVREEPDHITSLDIASEITGIDVIVDGHSHSYFDSAKKLRNTYIVSANEWGKYLGAGRLTVMNRKLVGFDWLPVPVGPDAEMLEALEPYIAQAETSLGPDKAPEMVEAGASGDADVPDFVLISGEEDDPSLASGETEIPFDANDSLLASGDDEESEPEEPPPAGLAAITPQKLRPRQAVQTGKAYELILLHTNDHHGAVTPGNAGDYGGLPQRAALVKIARALYPQILLVDAGDINSGSGLSKMFDAEPDFLGYSKMGYDAATFGSHEFDGGLDRLQKQMESADFPLVSSNVKTSDGHYLGVPYLVKAYDGFTVGLFGITTLRTKAIANPDSSLVFLDEIEAVQEIVDFLKNEEQVDIVIGLTHMGDKKESDEHITSLEAVSEVSGIDIIVDGHSHSYFDSAKKLGNTYIVSANEWGKYLGAGRLTVVNRKLAGFDWLPVPVGPDEEVIKALAPYIEKARGDLKTVIGKAAGTFEFGDRLTRKQETALGNAICDANVWYFKNVYKQSVDFAFHNGGNMRAELPAGNITQEQVLTILPFENYLYIASLKGAQITELFKFIASIPQGAGGWAQVSQEVRYTIDYSSGTGQLRDLTIHGQPVDPDKDYRFITNDYLLRGGDGYTTLLNAKEPFNTSLLLSYVFVEWIRSSGGVIAPSTDGRIKVIPEM